MDLERIKRDMRGNRFSDKELTVIELGEGLGLVAEIERLQVEVERLKAALDKMEYARAEAERFAREVTGELARLQHSPDSHSYDEKVTK